MACGTVSVWSSGQLVAWNGSTCTSGQGSAGVIRVLGCLLKCFSFPSVLSHGSSDRPAVCRGSWPWRVVAEHEKKWTKEYSSLKRPSWSQTTRIDFYTLFIQCKWRHVILQHLTFTLFNQILLFCAVLTRWMVTRTNRWNVDVLLCFRMFTMETGLNRLLQWP